MRRNTSIGAHSNLLLRKDRRESVCPPLLPDREGHREQGDGEEHRGDDVDLHRDAALGGTENVEGEGHLGPRREVGDHEVVDRQREGEQRAGDDPGPDQGKRDLAEGGE